MDIIAILVVILIFTAGIIVFLIKSNNKKKQPVTENQEEKNLYSITDDPNYRVEYVQDFLDFDKIVEDVIIREKGNKFTMIINCSGINFDLMSENEQVMLEEGFIGLLNFIQFPMQLYVQTRRVDLKDSIKLYNDRITIVRDELNSLTNQYNAEIQNKDADKQHLRMLLYQVQNKRNLYEYAVDLRDNIERMSINNNVLQQKYYICLTYRAEEAGILTEFNEEELLETARQELYNRCSSIISVLSGCSISADILSGNQLAELLYMAFNRDDGDMYRLKDSMEAGFYRLFSTIEEIDENRYDKYVQIDEKEQIVKQTSQPAQSTATV